MIFESRTITDAPRSDRRSRFENGDRLAEFIKSKTAGSTETVEMCKSASQGEKSQTLEVRDSKLSYNETKNTTKENTAKQRCNCPPAKLDSTTAASLKNEVEEKEIQKQRISHEQSLTASPSQNKAKSDSNKSNTGKEIRNGKVDYTVNKEMLSLLDSAGVPINRTIKDLLKLYPSRKVEDAIGRVRI